jgi:hypothetical protein
METSVIKFAHFLFAFMIGFVSCSYLVEFNHFIFSNNTGSVLFVTETGSPKLANFWFNSLLWKFRSKTLCAWEQMDASLFCEVKFC